MLQGADIDLFNQLVPKAHDSETKMTSLRDMASQHLKLPIQFFSVVTFASMVGGGE